MAARGPGDAVNATTATEPSAGFDQWVMRLAESAGQKAEMVVTAIKMV